MLVYFGNTHYVMDVILVCPGYCSIFLHDAYCFQVGLETTNYL